MAASAMVLGGCPARQCIPRCGSSLRGAWKAQAQRHSSYYVLLPEIPPDTAESNPIMQLNEFPDFVNITPENIVLGCAKLAIEFETGLGNHVQYLKDQKIEKTFDSVFSPLEETSVPLNFAWRTAKHLNYVQGRKGFRKAFQRIHPQVDRAKNERWISESLFYAVKEVNADRSILSEYQKRVVDMYLLESRLNGIMLRGNDKNRFVETLQKLSEERTNFRGKVVTCQSMFSHWISDFSMIRDMPLNIVTMIAADKANPTRGPWKVSLQHQVYQAFMEHCNNRSVRWNVWQGFNNRASSKFSHQYLGNHKKIEDIRYLRRDIAKLLGYSSFAQLSMETKMAGSIENVLNMIETFKSRFKPLAEEEIAKLQEFAVSEGFEHKLQMWDIPYWRNVQSRHLFGLDDQEVAQYFPLPDVLDGLFQMCRDLFGIIIKDSTNGSYVWHEDVKFYNIYSENGDCIASFYLDPYARPGEKIGGAWMETGRDRCDLLKMTPLSYLVLNLTKPRIPNTPCLMMLHDVNTLFCEFGHGLQQLLTTAPHSEVAGQKNVEWDALHICSSFMEWWLFLPQTLRSISSHFETGEPLPDDLVQKILRNHKQMAGYDMMRQLYLSAFDLEVYLSKDHWHEIMTRVWEEHMPVPLNAHDGHPCSFTHIFSDQYSAAYYSYKWSQMISADVFSAFEEAGLDQKDVLAIIGRRYRDTFLSMGGGFPASEVFRCFRGRDPLPDALQIYYGVK